MTDTTTAPGASGDAGTSEPDWPAKYAGMTRLAEERRTAAEQAKARADAAEAELATYKAREAEATEEAAAQAEYERLRARFEEEPPTPGVHNEARAERQRPPVSTGTWQD